MARRVRTKRYRKKKYGKKKSIKSIVKATLNKMSETKMLQYNTWSNSSSISYGSGTSIGAFFNPITQGTGEGNRIGNKVIGRGMQIRLAIQPGDNTNYLRVLVVKAKGSMAPKVLPSDGIALFTQSVLSNISSSSTQWLAPVDTDRFKVLFDKNYFMRYGPLDGNSGSTIINKMVFIKKFLRFNQKLQWDESGTLNSDIWLLMLSDSAAVVHPGVVAGFIRVYFKDI